LKKKTYKISISFISLSDPVKVKVAETVNFSFIVHEVVLAKSSMAKNFIIIH